jgi:hypothetical protein
MDPSLGLWRVCVYAYSRVAYGGRPFSPVRGGHYRRRWRLHYLGQPGAGGGVVDAGGRGEAEIVRLLPVVLPWKAEGASHYRLTPWFYW